MKESDAKTKWCPMIQVSVVPEAETETNRGWRRGLDYDCIGSECMMWRWKDAERVSGYCGLAAHIQ